MLHLRTDLPAGFFEISPRDVHRLLPGPTLIHLEGERDPPLFVSLLLHGNEPAGLRAMQRVLGHFSGRPLPRSLLLFVGNVEAAREGLRRRDGQPDYNRIWLPGPTKEHALAARVLEEVRARGAFASVDIHNNTGHNPHYGCVNDLSPGSLHLVARFDERAIYATTPKGVLTAALSALCPAVTLECGRPDDESGYEHAARFVLDVLSLDEIPAAGPYPERLKLYESGAVLHVADDVHFAFEGGPDVEDPDLVFPQDLDTWNFRDLPRGSALATVRRGLSRPLRAHGTDGEDLTDRLFAVEEGHVITRERMTPSMLTLDARVIRQDCLGYLLVPRALD